MLGGIEIDETIETIIAVQFWLVLLHELPFCLFTGNPSFQRAAAAVVVVVVIRMTSSSFTISQPSSSTNHPMSLPRLLQLQSEGRFSSQRFQRELIRRRCSSRTLLSSPKIAMTSNGGVSAEKIMITTSLDISNEGRFLLAGQQRGSIALFDLSYWGSHEDGRFVLPLQLQQPSPEYPRVHSPVSLAPPVAPPPPPSSSRDRTRPSQRVVTHPTGHYQTVVSARWYPVDSGAFFTASYDGHVLIWDSATMTVVSSCVPFRCDDDEDRSPQPLHTMQVSLLQPQLLAVSSMGQATVQLMDVRTGSAAHTLQGHAQRGVRAVQWSPVSPHVLASGGNDRTIRLYDIRKPHPRHQLCCFHQDALPSSTSSSVVKAAACFQPHYAHLRDKQNKHGLGRNGSSRVPALAHDDKVDRLAWTRCGQYLVSSDDSSQITTWDLRLRSDSAGGGPLPVWKRTVRSTNNNNHYPRRSSPSVLLTTDDGNCQDIIWYARESRTLVGLPLLEDVNHYGAISGANAAATFPQSSASPPSQHLQGHLASLVDAVAAPIDSYSSGQIFTSGLDGMILVWGAREPARAPRSKLSALGFTTTTTRKRRR